MSLEADVELGRRKVNPFTQPIAKPKKVGPETNSWFWHPDRPQGGPRAPLSFLEQLEKVDSRLTVRWNPAREKWAVWIKDDRFRHPICQGWKLLFIHHDGKDGYLPLDNRLFARLYSADLLQWGGAKAYWQQVQSQMERDKEQQERELTQEAIDHAMPFYEHSQIKNIGKGSKFATYHA